jgi:uncharacterized protein YycO
MKAPLGKILMFRGGNPISWLVKVQTRSIYSHVAMLVPGTNRCVESYPGKGVQERELTDKDMHEIDMYDVKGMNAEMWDYAISFARAQMGQGYDWHSVMRFVSKIPARENSRWFCSELVHKAIAEAGVRLLERIPSANVAPAHIAISPLLVAVTNEPDNVIS